MRPKKYSSIVINGKFMSQRLTGVQRYAREILLELDKLADSSVDIVLLTDKNAVDIPDYKNIRVVSAGKLAGNIWEQITLPAYAIRHKALCVSLCNMAPILKPDVVTVHDINFKVNKNFFSKKFVQWYNFVFFIIMKRIKTIFTVSEFSKSEIECNYGISPEKIIVTYNGWQHYERISADTQALAKFGLISGDYYFSMSSMSPNKNFKWVAQAAKDNPDVLFAVSGAVNSKVFADTADLEAPENLKFLGYISDEEAKALISHCRAFLFPSFYEGFGIPPLEALSTGAKAVVSDSSCMKEIFGDSVYYISPYYPHINLNAIVSEKCGLPDAILEKYSWAKSAAILYKNLLMYFSPKSH